MKFFGDVVLPELRSLEAMDCREIGKVRPQPCLR
jgi:hypothetical protein